MRNDCRRLSRLERLPLAVTLIFLLATGSSQANSAETAHASHWSKDLRVGANMDMSAEIRDYDSDVGRQLLDLREVELSLEAQIKPWLYGLIFLSRPSDEEMGLEEAAVIADLSPTLRLKAGLYRNEFGLINTIHEPERPQVSLPLPVVAFLGDEQLRERAVTIGRLLDLGSGYRVAVSGALMNSDNDVALDAGLSGEKAYAAKLYLGRQSDEMAFQVGLSALSGKNKVAGRTQLQVLDFRFMLQPAYASALDYPARLIWMGEVLSNRRGLGAGINNKAFGFWTLVDYQFKPAHHVGVGTEYVQGLSDNAIQGRAWSVHYSWYYTAHGRLQLQARYLDDDVGEENGTQVLLQWNVVLGPHSERPFMTILPMDEKM